MQDSVLEKRVFVGAGSRDGDRMAMLGDGVRLLREQGVRAVRLSSIYETEPVGLEGAEPLLNGVLETDPDVPPGRLLEACLEAERRLGRQRRSGGPGAPDQGLRPLDLDVLLYGPLVLERPGLTVPHPRLHQRRFVLVPLVEIAPEAWHPLLHASCATLLDLCPDSSWIRLHAPPSAWERATASLK